MIYGRFTYKKAVHPKGFAEVITTSDAPAVHPFNVYGTPVLSRSKVQPNKRLFRRNRTDVVPSVKGSAFRNYKSFNYSKHDISCSSNTACFNQY